MYELGELGNGCQLLINTIIILLIICEGDELDNLAPGEVADPALPPSWFLHVKLLESGVLGVYFGQAVVGLGDETFIVAVFVFQFWIEPLVPSLRQFVQLNCFVTRCVVVVVVFDVEFGFMVAELEFEHLEGFLVNDVSFRLAAPFGLLCLF